MSKAARKIGLLDKWKAMDRATKDARLKGTDICVFYRLLFHHNSKTNRCFPSQETMAEALNTTTRTIRNALTKLDQCGYVKNLGQRAGRSSNGYALNILGEEEFFHASGKNFPKQRKDTSGETKKEKEKETGELASEKNDCSKANGLSQNAAKPPDLSVEKFQKKLVAMFGGGCTGWDALMAVKTDVLEKLEEAYLSGEMGITTARNKILEHLKDVEQQSV